MHVKCLVRTYFIYAELI